MPVEFCKEVLTSQYLDQATGEARSFPLEVRTDPLTGEQGTVFSSSMASRDYHSNAAEVPALVQRSLELGCPFCPGTLEKVTPHFPPQIAPEGVIRYRESVVFPNRDLFHTPFIAILIPSPQHYIPIEAFPPEVLAQGMEAAQVYFRRVEGYESRSRFHTINWNYFPPAGGSIIHTHLQLLGTPLPPNRHRRLMEASRDYQSRQGRNYWADLLATERELAERYIGQKGRVAWLSPYVPRGRLWDVMALLEGGGSVLDMTPQDFRDLAQGITQVMKFLHSQGFYSFNFSLLSSPRGEEAFWTQGFLLPRATTQPMGMSDCSYLDTLLDQPSTSFFPEAIARQLREYLQ